jgi:WD40 repeat protein
LPPDAPGGNCPSCLWALAAALTEETPRGPGPRRFGSYQLLEEIARGGMGVVWRARQDVLGREVALKMVLAGHLATSAQVLRFYTEARAAARLSHPNIVPIFDIGEEDGCHFYSMQLMEGRSLADLLREEGVPPQRRAAHLVATVARAIHFAHQRGVLHRDVKPSNILLDAGGQPHVVDFGLARIAEDSAGATRTDAILGTPAYMAPEQAGGTTREVTTAADVYGLGAVLHELLTGKPPFAGGTTIETLRRVLDEAPPPARSLNPGVDRSLEVICLKCLEKDPGRRYGSAAELADDLDRWIAGRPILARPASSLERLASWARRKPELATALAALSVVLAAALAVSLALLLRVQSESAARAAALRSEEGQRLALQSLAVVADNPGQALLLALEAAARTPSTSVNNALLTSLETCRERRRFLGHAWSVRHASFSPDGTRLVTASDDRTARLWSVATGESVGILEGHRGGVTTAVFDGEGRRVLTASQDATARIWDAGSDTELLVLSGHAHPLRSAAFSPDGTRVLTVSQNTARLWDSRSGDVLQRLEQHTAAVLCGRFSPDGRQAVTGSLDGTARIWDVETGAVLATLAGEGKTVLEARYSADGQRIATGEDRDACVWDAATGQRLAVLRGHTYGVYSVAWTADGSLLATGSEDFTARIWDARTGQQLHVLPHGHKVISVDIAPGGGLLLTASYDKSARIWDLRSGALVAELRGHAAPVNHAAFAPGGRELVTASVDFTARLWTVQPAQPLTVAAETDPALVSADLSPDGKHLAATYYEGTAVRLVELATGREVARLEGHTDRVWVARFQPDGSRLVTGAADGTVRLWDARTGSALGTIGACSGTVSLATFSPDGRWLATGATDGTIKLWRAADGAEAATFRCERAARTVRFSPDSTLLAATDDAGKLQIAEVPSGQLRDFTRQDSSLVLAADFGAGGSSLITASITTKAFVYSFPGGRVEAALVHPTRVGHVWCSPSRRWLAALLDDAVIVWDLESREEWMEIRRPRSRPSQVVFTPDSRSALVIWHRFGEREAPVTAAVIYPLDVHGEARNASLGELTPDERDRFKVGSTDERRAHRQGWRGGQIYGTEQR